MDFFGKEVLTGPIINWFKEIKLCLLPFWIVGAAIGGGQLSVLAVRFNLTTAFATTIRSITGSVTMSNDLKSKAFLVAWAPEVGPDHDSE